MGLRGVLAVHENLIESCPECFVSGRDGKALEEGAIDSVFLHPLEVQIGGGGADRAVNFCDRTVGMLESSGDAVFLREFANVGPEVDGAMAGFKRSVFGIMSPAIPGAIGRSAEPSLIAAHHFALKTFALERMANGES